MFLCVCFFVWVFVFVFVQVFVCAYVCTHASVCVCVSVRVFFPGCQIGTAGPCGRRKHIDLSNQEPDGKVSCIDSTTGEPEPRRLLLRGVCDGFCPSAVSCSPHVLQRGAFGWELYLLPPTAFV